MNNNVENTNDKSQKTLRFSVNSCFNTHAYLIWHVLYKHLVTAQSSTFTVGFCHFASFCGHSGREDLALTLSSPRQVHLPKTQIWFLQMTCWDSAIVTLASLRARSCGPRGSCAGLSTLSTEGWQANTPAGRNQPEASWSHSTAPWTEGKKRLLYCETCTDPTFTSLWSSNIIETQESVWFGDVTKSNQQPSSRPGQPLLQGFARFLRVLSRFSEPAQATGDAMHMCVNSWKKKGQK